MTQISLSKAYAIIDNHRGEILAFRRAYKEECGKDSEPYRTCNEILRRLNRLKKEFALVSDADQLPLGL